MRFWSCGDCGWSYAETTYDIDKCPFCRGDDWQKLSKKKFIAYLEALIKEFM